MFQFGAAVAQQRCTDVNEVMGWHLPESSDDGCAEEGTLRTELDALQASIERGGCFALKNELQLCGDERPEFK